MGGGGGQQQTSTTEPWAEQKPYLSHGFSEAERIYGEGPAPFYPGQTYTDMSDATQQGLSTQTGIAQGGNPLVENAAGYAANTLGGGGDNPYSGILDSGVQGMQDTASGAFLNNNPHLDNTYDAAAGKLTRNFSEDIMPALGAQFGMGDMTGSTMHELYAGKAAGGLTDSLAALGADIYGGDYARERDRMTGAQQGLTSAGTGLYGTGVNERMGLTSMAPSLREAQYGDAAKLRDAGAAYEGQAGKALEDDINRYNYGQNADTAALQDYLAMISGNFGSTSTSRTSQSGSGLNSGLGAMATMLSMFG